MEMEIFWIIGGVILGYFWGSFFQPGYWVGKMKGEDIREKGSGSTGGTNVGRLYGWKFGIPVILLDSLKCLILTSIAYWVLRDGMLTMAVMLSVIAGHMYPCFYDFQGGKGVASAAGGLIPMLGWLFIPFIGYWFVLLLIVRTMSLANLIMALFVPVFLWWAQHSGNYANYVFFGVLLIILVYYSHRENIGRLIRGEEKRIF